MRTLRRAFAWFALVKLLGCSIHPEGITDLIGDGYSYVRFPGRRVFDTPLSAVTLDITRDGSFVALAITDAGDLIMGDLNGKSYCNAGPASVIRTPYTYYQRPGRHRDWVAYLYDTDADGWGTLGFVSHDCTKHVRGASRSKLLGWVMSLEPPRFLAQSERDSGDVTGRATLLLCEPALSENPCKPLATVDEIAFDGVNLWTREVTDGGLRLVVRDQALEVLATLGSDVSEFVLGTNGFGIAYLDRGTLRTFLPGVSAGDSVITSDACELKAVLSRSRPRTAFTYRSPCANGSLYLYDGALNTPLQLASGATAPVISEQRQDTAPWFFYVVEPSKLPSEPDHSVGLAKSFQDSYGTPAPTNVGVLAATTTAGDTLFGPTRSWLGSFNWNFSTRARILSEFDGKSGKLVEWDLSSGKLVELAASAADFSWGWVITREEDTGGSFVDLRRDAKSPALMNDVQGRGEVYNEHCIVGSIDCLTSKLEDNPAERRAILSDVTGYSGTLWLLSRRDANAVLDAPELLDDAVYEHGYNFLRNGDAVLYLRNFREREGTGTLTARFVETLDAYSVDHVSSWWELFGGVPGILYVTRGGKPGLWFAELH